MTQAANSFLSIAIGAGNPPDPYDSPDAWDYVRVGGVLSPMRCRLSEFKRKWDWDEKKGKGAAGAKLTHTGFHLARGTITFFLLYGPDKNGQPYTHLRDWAWWSKNFKYDPTKSIITAVPIYHPALAMIDVDSIVCEDLGAPTMTDMPGLMTAKVSVIEFSPPSPLSAVASPSVSAPTAGLPKAFKPPGLPNDPLSDELQAKIKVQLAIAQKPLP